jgi:hypothetical protein
LVQPDASQPRSQQLCEIDAGSLVQLEGMAFIDEIYGRIRDRAPSAAEVERHLEALAGGVATKDQLIHDLARPLRIRWGGVWPGGEPGFASAAPAEPADA